MKNNFMIGMFILILLLIVISGWFIKIVVESDFPLWLKILLLK